MPTESKTEPDSAPQQWRGPETLAGAEQASTWTSNSLPVFAFLWASAILCHQSKWASWIESPADLTFSVAAFLLLLWPGSLWLLAGVSVAQVWESWYSMPWISNHWMFTTFVSLTILAAYGAVALRQRSCDSKTLFETVAPLLRLELIVLYFFAVFHKLNADFFKPEVSCAAALYLRVAGKLAFLPTQLWAQQTAIYLSLLIEAAIPVLLMLRPLRIAGILLGAGFHYLLALDGYFNFASMLFAMFFLFAPADFLDLFSATRAGAWFQRLRRAVQLRLWQRLRSGLTLLIVSVGAICLLVSPWTGRPWFKLIQDLGDVKATPRHMTSYLFEYGWYVFGLALIVIFVYTIRAGGRARLSSPSRLFRVRPALLLCLPILMFVNGSAPYLGIKTETAFAMYSNLRIEAGHSNHFLVPESLNLLPYMQDLVTIHAATDTELQKVAERDYLIPYFEFSSYVSRRVTHDDDFSVVYERGGEISDVASVRSDSELRRPLPYFVRKLLFYRTVQLQEVNTCRH